MNIMVEGVVEDRCASGAQEAESRGEDIEEEARDQIWSLRSRPMTRPETHTQVCLANTLSISEANQVDTQD